MKEPSRRIRLRLPATSANLGPGFDAAAVALDFHLEIEAEAAGEFSISATGRDADRCARLEDNLILGIYRRLLGESGRPVVPLALRMDNGIPLGMGCGSSAAGRLAGILLAVHYGGLGWSPEQVLEEAAALEGHPDNAAACWLGGFVTAACEGRRVHVAQAAPPARWHALVVLPELPLATSEARGILPETYSRGDAVANVQSVSLLAMAFAQGRGDLLRIAMRDRLHQPCRAEICELLPPLLPLAGSHGILGVALSGAGPAVLAVLEGGTAVARASSAILQAVGALSRPEIVPAGFAAEGAKQFILNKL